MIDEAHNLPSVAEDAASLEITVMSLQTCYRSLGQFKKFLSEGTGWKKEEGYKNRQSHSVHVEHLEDVIGDLEKKLIEFDFRHEKQSSLL